MTDQIKEVDAIRAVLDAIRELSLPAKLRVLKYVAEMVQETETTTNPERGE